MRGTYRSATLANWQVQDLVRSDKAKLSCVAAERRTYCCCYWEPHFKIGSWTWVTVATFCLWSRKTRWVINFCNVEMQRKCAEVHYTPVCIKNDLYVISTGGSNNPLFLLQRSLRENPCKALESTYLHVTQPLQFYLEKTDAQQSLKTTQSISFFAEKLARCSFVFFSTILPILSDFHLLKNETIWEKF